MSDNIEYKAILNLYEKLVQAVVPEIDTLLTKAWSKNIVVTQQLDGSLEPTANSIRKARALVSGVAARVNLDRSAFGKFLNLFKEVHSLKYIADCLEREVLKMSSSQSASAGASSNSSPGPTSRHRNIPSRPPDEVPKLDLAELGPIAGEEATDKEDTSGSTDTMVHVPEAESSQKYIKSFRKVAGGDSAQGGVAGVSVTNEDDVNLAVITHGEDVSPVSEVMEREGANEQQELVLASSQQTATGENEKDVTESAVVDILRDNKRKNTEIRELKEELARLRVEVESLNKENLELKDKLQSKEQESERSKEEYEQQINSLLSILQGKEEN